MSEWHVELNAIEQRLLASWVRGPSFRERWTPEPAEFFTVANQALARACSVLAALGPIDVGIQLVEELARAGDLKRHWPMGQSPLPIAASKDPDADLSRWRTLRCLFALLTRLQEVVSVCTPGSDLATVRNAVLDATSKASISGAAKSYSLGQGFALAYSEMTRRDRAGSFSGYQEIDEATGGIRPGHVWVLGAPTNWGKSSWLISVADHYIDVHGKGVLLITCEDAPELLFTRWLCRRANLRGGKARDANLSYEERAAAATHVADAATRSKAPVMLDGRGRPVEALAEDIRSAVSAHGIGLVLVDYLQCIATLRDTQDRRGEINHIARTLTDAIKMSGAGGVLASQLTGEDIRESRDVEHAAEVVLIGRKEEKSGELSLFVKKNKTGGSGFIEVLKFDKQSGSFETRKAEDFGIKDHQDTDTRTVR